MKKFLLILILCSIISPSYAFGFRSAERDVKNVILSQFKYANRGNFDKFISTFDPNYVNSDGFNLEVYSNIVKNVWSSYDNIRYGVKIKNVEVNNDRAVIDVTEYTNADLPLSKKYTGILTSQSESTYYLSKTNGKWKVVSDSVSDETTKMLYGIAKNMDISLRVPNEVKADTEYTATLEFETPEGVISIASIAVDKVEYPQPQTKEVFRPMPEDNILERLFTANNENANEYVLASFGLTKTAVCDLSVKMSLLGFGYVIKRVNVLPANQNEIANDKN